MLSGIALVGAAGTGPAWAADCNRNGIRDVCDIDCGANGGECDVPGCGGSADANANGIPDECEGCPTPGSFTTSADFAQGVSINLDTGVPGQLRRNELPQPLPNLWVAASARGTIVRIDTTTGEVVGEYFTAPDGRGRDPSRTSVNLNGEVWVTNRDEGSQFGKGSATKIGLVVGGTPVETWCVLDNRVTLAPPFAYNTCIDRNGDGYITTSGGLDPLDWPNPEPGPDPVFGSVATAVDECIVRYVPTTGQNARHVTVDKDNNVWVGGRGNNAFDLLDGFTGEIVRDDQDRERTFNIGTGGYGGLIDCNGVLWSVSKSGNIGLFRYNTARDIYDPDCCEADLLTDSNNDGVIDRQDELDEESQAVIFPVNSDNDNMDTDPDFEDEGPVENEDDLQEVKLLVSCYIDDPTAWWSLSWTDPDPDGDPDTPTIKIWRRPDKSDGEDPPGPGDDIDNGALQYSEWPPPTSVWVEALDTYDEIEITFTVSYNEARAQKTDIVRTKGCCWRAWDRYWVGVGMAQGAVTMVAADISTSPVGPLCDGAEEAYKAPGMSMAWVNASVMLHPPWVDEPFHAWAQMGYGRHSIDYEILGVMVYFPTNQRYAELESGPAAWPEYYQLYYEVGLPESGTHNYKVRHMGPVFDVWAFDFDCVPFHFLGDPVWYGQTAASVSWKVEMLNKDDRCPGRETARCIFSECEFQRNWSSEQHFPDFAPEYIQYSGWGNPGAEEYAKNYLGPRSFEVWDPNP